MRGFQRVRRHMNGSHVCLSFTLGMNRDAFALDFHLPAQILLTVNPEPIGQAVLDDARIFGSDRHDALVTITDDDLAALACVDTRCQTGRFGNVH